MSLLWFLLIIGSFDAVIIDQRFRENQLVSPKLIEYDKEYLTPISKVKWFVTLNYVKK